VWQNFPVVRSPMLMEKTNGSARVYGVTGTFTSHAAVTRGFVSGLSENAVFGGLFSLNDRDTWDSDDDSSTPSGATCPVGILTGALSESHQMMHWGKHEHRMAMVAPNSSALPAKLMTVLNQHCTALLGPSGWACDVIRKHTSLPVYKAPHGLDSEFSSAGEPVDLSAPAKSHHVLHFSTSDRQRKGTFELIQAWAYLKDANKIPSDVRLKLVLNDFVIFQNEKRLVGLDKWGIDVIRRPCQGNGFAPSQMARVLRNALFVVQPSRGEGFGLQPLSALACGTPIVATDCTGHSEYLNSKSLQDGFVRVRTGPDVEIDDLPGEGSVAPELRWEWVADSLGFAFDVLPLLKEAAMDKASSVAEEWSWGRQLESFSNIVRKI
jgi:glycosyltransferase involved in cell wall biosynthesis